MILSRPGSRIALAGWMAWMLLAFGQAAGSAEGTPEAKVNLAPLVQDLDQGMEYRRIIAVQLLGRVGSPEALALMTRAMLRDRSDTVRRAAQRELANREFAGLMPAIHEALADPERRVRLAAVEALGLARAPEAAVWLLGALRAEPRDGELTLTGLEALRNFVYHLEPAPGFERDLEPYLNHSDRRVRLTTIAILGILARPASLPALRALWPKADSRTRVLLADAFANIGWAAPVPDLIEVLRGRDTEAGIHALYALSQIQAFSALGPIRTLAAETRDPRLCIAAINALIGIPDPENIPAVLKLLDHPDSSVRHWAAYALGELNAQSAVPALTAKLKDPASLVRATAVTALAELKVASLEPEYLKLLDDPAQENDVRVSAARALMRLGSRSGGEAFWREMSRNDVDLTSKLSYALALGAARDDRLTARLQARLGDDDFLSSFTAALALGTRGDALARTPLMHALDHGDRTIRRYAILGLENIRDAAAVQALSQSAGDDPDPLVRILCASSLVAAGHPEFRVVLWNALDSKDEDQRTEAVLALGRTADAEVLRQLKWYLRREPAVPVRENILRLLRTHAGR